MQRNPAIQALAERAGIVFPGAMQFLPRVQYTADKRGPKGETSGFGEIIMDELPAEIRAMDAQPGLITTPNAGVPSLFTTYIDPKLIEVILMPNNGVKIMGETRKGDWLDDTVGFQMIESVGETTAYGDWADGGGMSTANNQWVWRQPFLFQTWTEWGERETERMGRGRIDWVSRLNISSAVNLDKYYNNSLFYGVSGLALYGLLNDPSLSAALTPTTKAATGTSWSNALAQEILADVQKMFATLQTQTGSNLEMDTPMVLALHSVSETYLANTNAYGLVSAYDLLKKTFPGLRVQQAPQYLSGTTYSCQLIVDEIQGQRVVEGGFNEKMRAHRVVYASSSAKQKKTSGTIGALIYQPIGIVTMSGI
jgi:hypothetical protein